LEILEGGLLAFLKLGFRNKLPTAAGPDRAAKEIHSMDVAFPTGGLEII
jgi:hypothetical protein